MALTFILKLTRGKTMLQRKAGRPTDKVRNLRKFAEQWAEFEDEMALEFGSDDADYVLGVLKFDRAPMDRYENLTIELEA